MGTLGLD